MHIKHYTGRSVILMILIHVLSPYPFFKKVMFAHEFVHEFMCEFMKEFSQISCMNLSTKFIGNHANSYKFISSFCTKNWLCYELPVHNKVSIECLPDFETGVISYYF